MEKSVLQIRFAKVAARQIRFHKIRFIDRTLRKISVMKFQARKVGIFDQGFMEVDLQHEAIAFRKIDSHNLAFLKSDVLEFAPVDRDQA